MHAERRIRKGLMGRRGRLKAKSGTCNVCSAPCSSCMYHNLDSMGSKPDESSEGTCHRPVASQCSMNEDDVLPSSRVKAHKHRNSNYTANEASNLVSVNSNHDSSSENAESRGVVRSSDASGDSEDIVRPEKISYAGIGFVNKRDPEVNADLIRCNVSNKDRRSKCDEDHEESQGVSDVHRSDYAPTHSEINKKCGAESSKAGDHSSVHYSDQNDSYDKSDIRVQTHDSEELKSPARSEDESDDVELLELDVKVCDICGDAGREDLLAICCGCSDGAEHTYCMREKLQKVPEGEWLCEECKFAVEAEKQKQDARVKRENRVLSGKRHAENLVAAAVTKRQVIDSGFGSPKVAISRADALSRNSSFNCTNKVMKTLAHQTSFDHHHNGNVEKLRSTCSQHKPPKGALFKSKSFNTNMKPKVKLVDDVVLPRQKGAKEFTSLDMKDGCSRTISKSMSFRSTNVASDSKGIVVSPKFSHPQEVLGIKQAKNKSRFEKKDLSKSDCSVGCSKTACSTVSTVKVDKRPAFGDSDSQLNANKNRELKGLQSDCRSSCLTKQDSSLTRTRLERPSASAKASSAIRTGGSIEQNLNQSISKDDPPSTSSESAEGYSGHRDGMSQDILSRFRESRNLRQNTREAVVNRPRSALSRASKGIKSHKDGHIAEQGSTGEPAASELDSCSTKYHREEMGKGSRLRAAVDAALRKKPAFVKNRGRDQLDPSVASSELTLDKSSQSRLPVSNMAKDPIFIEERNELPNFHASDSFKKKNAISGQHLAFPSTDVKPILREWPLAAKTSVMPEHEFIWQGNLEVQRGRNLPKLHTRIQAHISNLASSKVHEVSHKLPEIISLSEVQRSTIWPAQFHRNGAKEDHIGLFFFAEDIESYEKHYKPLVDNMMKRDLALKGNLDNVELLIFASNQLPQNCRLWNMFFFLWGVFRGRKESLSNLPKSTSSHGLNVLPQNRSIPHVLHQNHSSFKHDPKESAVCESLCTDLSSVRSEANFKHPSFPAKLESSNTQAYCKEGDVLQEPTPLEVVGGSKTAENSSREVRSFEIQDIGSRISVKDEKMQAGEDPLAFLRNYEVCSTTRRESYLANDPSCDQGNHRKRPYLELAESEKSLARKDEVPLTDLNRVFADVEESFNIKPRTDSDGDNVRIFAGNIFRKGNIPPENSNLDSSSATVNTNPASDDERSIQNNMKQPKRFIFPVDLNQGCDEQQLNDGVPDIEVSVQTDGRYNGDKVEEDDIAASLSLSLSFPFPDKKQGGKRVMETEPGTGRSDVNTSLLLFSGLADK